jgi:integrase
MNLVAFQADGEVLTLEEVIAAFPDLPPDSVENLAENYELALAGGYSKNTLRALKYDGGRFVEWCVEAGKVWMPAAPKTISEFVTAMGDGGRRRGATEDPGYAPATIDRMVASIALWHKLAELPTPIEHVKVDMARRVHAEARGRGQVQPAGLTRKKLDVILQRIQVELDEIGALGPHISPEDDRRRLVALRDRAMLATGYCILARGSELLALRWSDLSQTDEGKWVIKIRRSKTDQEGLGAYQHLFPWIADLLLEWKAAHDQALKARKEGERQRRLDFCLKQGYERQRKKEGAVCWLPTELLWVETEFMFRGLNPGLGERPPLGTQDSRKKYGWPPSLSLTGLNEVIASRVAAAAPAAVAGQGNYSSHSLRIGAAQDLVADGKSLAAIMRDGRWEDPKMVLRYCAQLLASRGAMAEMDWEMAA